MGRRGGDTGSVRQSGISAQFQQVSSVFQSTENQLVRAFRATGTPADDGRKQFLDDQGEGNGQLQWKRWNVDDELRLSALQGRSAVGRVQVRRDAGDER